MIISVNKSASHQWAGQTLRVPDGIGMSMVRRGIATEGGKLDTVADKDSDLIPSPDTAVPPIDQPAPVQKRPAKKK